MNQDEQQLRILSIFHYVVGGLAGLFALFPILHLVLGIFFILAPNELESGGRQPPEIIGWMFVIVAASLITIGWIFAGCVIAAGRCLARRKAYTYCLVMAGVECIFMPFGTALGVFSIVVLTRESVKVLFQPSEVSVAL